MAISVRLMSVYALISIYLNSAIILAAYISYGRFVKKSILFLLTFTFYMFISVYYNSGGIGSVLTFAMSVLSLELLSEIDFDDKDNSYLICLSGIMVILLFLASFQYGNGGSFDYEGLINPNSLAVVINYSFSIFLCTNNKKNVFNKSLNLILFIIAFLALINCEARGAFVSLFCFFILLVIPRKLINGKTIFFLTLAIIIIGTMIPLIYLYLYSQNVQIGYVLNKSLFTGRQAIWIEAFAIFGDNIWNWLLGIGSKVKLWEYATNLHNAYLTAIVDFGIVGYILYFGFILKYIRTVCRSVRNNREIQKWLFLYLSLGLVQGFTETSIFSSTLFVLSNFGLARAYQIARKNISGGNIK